jgi:ubiquitin carboxyl-terminal hydrolase 5/13
VGEGWVPKKMDVLVDMPDCLDLENLRGHGPQPNEVLQPADPMPTAPVAPPNTVTEFPPVVPDEELVAQLVSMGFQENVCRRAAIATGNAGVEMAMEWVLIHLDDDENMTTEPGGAETSQAGHQTGAAAAAAAPCAGGADVEKISMLTAMGFSDQQAEAALLVSCSRVKPFRPASRD